MLLCHGWKESDRLLECIDSACDGNEDSDFSSEGEVEEKLLGEGEEGGSGNSHCCVVFSVAISHDYGCGGWRLHRALQVQPEYEDSNSWPASALAGIWPDYNCKLLGSDSELILSVTGLIC